MHGAEIVTSAGAQAGVVARIFHQMAGIEAAVVCAPLADLTDEVLFIELGDQIHIGIANGSVGLFAAVVPQSGSRRYTQGHMYRSAAAPTHHTTAKVPVLADTGVILIARTIACDVAKLRLVGKKATEGLSKMLLIAVIHWLIQGVNQYTDRFAVDHVDVSVAPGRLIRLEDHQNVPQSFGNVPIQHPSTTLPVRSIHSP